MHWSGRSYRYAYTNGSSLYRHFQCMYRPSTSFSLYPTFETSLAEIVHFIPKQGQGIAAAQSYCPGTSSSLIDHPEEQWWVARAQKCPVM